MKILLILLAIVVACLLTLSIGLLAYNLHLGKTLSDVSKTKIAELEENMASQRKMIKEDLADKYKKEMDAFAEVAENLGRIKQKEKELEESVKNKLAGKLDEKSERKVRNKKVSPAPLTKP